MCSYRVTLAGATIHVGKLHVAMQFSCITANRGYDDQILCRFGCGAEGAWVGEGVVSEK
jgi:hypothetical protein